jgi:hypothetical protein
MKFQSVDSDGKRYLFVLGEGEQVEIVAAKDETGRRGKILVALREGGLTFSSRLGPPAS